MHSWCPCSVESVRTGPKEIVGIVLSAHCDYKIYEMKTFMSSRVHEV